MEVLIINLSRATERMAFQERQMEALGLAYTRLNASDVQATTQYPATYWNTWERPLLDTEKACFLSHQRAWAQIVAGDKPALVLEDDAFLSPDTPALLELLQSVKGIDFLTLETRGRKKLLASKQKEQEKKLGIRRIYQDRSGAAAYVLWPKGARKLLRRARTRTGLADAIICAAYELEAFQADPALAIQIDQCEFYGLVPPIQTRSTIATDSQLAGIWEGRSTSERLHFRIKRLLSQLRMGIRFVSKAAISERRYVNPAQQRSFDT